MDRPAFDRTYFEVLSVTSARDAVHEWALKSDGERIAAALFLREATYGRDHVAERIPRVLEVLRAPWCADTGVRGVCGEPPRATKDHG
jgi:hypothetical protein